MSVVPFISTIEHFTKIHDYQDSNYAIL